MTPGQKSLIQRWYNSLPDSRKPLGMGFTAEDLPTDLYDKLEEMHSTEVLYYEIKYFVEKLDEKFNERNKRFASGKQPDVSKLFKEIGGVGRQLVIDYPSGDSETMDFWVAPDYEDYNKANKLVKMGYLTKPFNDKYTFDEPTKIYGLTSKGYLFLEQHPELINLRK